MSFFPFLGCPKCYKDRETVNPINQKTMEQLYKDTVRKVKYLKENGFEVEQKWGCELAKEMEEDEEMKQFFEEYEIVEPLQPRDAFYGDVRMLRNYSMSVRAMRRSCKLKNV